MRQSISFYKEKFNHSHLHVEQIFNNRLFNPAQEGLTCPMAEVEARKIQTGNKESLFNGEHN